MSREHFYVNHVNLNGLAARDVRGAIQLSKLEGREGKEIKIKIKEKEGDTILRCNFRRD